MLNSQELEYKSYFFVGIGGVSMSALAKILINNGMIVAGYDRVCGQSVECLWELGIEVTDNLNADVSSYDCIVYTDAIASNNIILLNAMRLGKVIIFSCA